MRPSVRTSSSPVSAAHLAATQPTSTNAERTRRSPGARGRVSRAKLKKSFSAPPVNAHPYTLPPRRMPARFAAWLASTKAAWPARGKWMSVRRRLSW